MVRCADCSSALSAVSLAKTNSRNIQSALQIVAPGLKPGKETKKVALAFVSVGIVNAGAGSSAVGLSAYITREERADKITQKPFEFTDRETDLVAKGMILPDHAPEEFRDGEKLWNAAIEAETVIDRKTGEVRFSERAGKSPQVAKHFIIALPWDEVVTDAQRVEMAEAFLREQFAASGVAVEFAVHRYGTAFRPADAEKDAEVKKQVELIDRLKIEKIPLKHGDEIPDHLRGPHVIVWTMPDGSERWQLYQPHAHAIVSTRRVEETGFRTEKGRPTEKARELNPDFGRFGRVSEEQGWRHRWRDFQQGYFAANGLAVEVQEERAVPEKHLGKARSRGVATDIENADREAERQAAALEPDAMLDHMTMHRSTFDLRSVVAELRRHGLSNAEAEGAAERIIAHDRVVALVDKETGQAVGQFTTREVRAEEEGTLADWIELAGRQYRVSEKAMAVAAQAQQLDPEQATAFRLSLSGPGAVVIQGDPGTGKTHTMTSIRLALEADGVACWGTSNMNAVVRDMAKAGFDNADTLAAFVGRLEDGRLALTGRNAIIVDEAAMTDNAMLGRLARQALRYKARVVIVGDDKQNAAVARGGLYTDIREAIGFARLSEVRRHKEDWQKQATKDLAAGQVAQAIKAYDDEGRIKWHGTIDTARAALVEHALRLQAEGKEVYILASVNREVDKLNPALRAALGLPPGIECDTVRGRLEISEGERIQLYASKKRDGLYNATFGTVEQIDERGHLHVLFDDGHRAPIDPARFRDFGYGYAGTIYRDQGKSRHEVLALYDSRFMWGKETTLVGLSRQKHDVHLYVPRELAADRGALVAGMSRSRAKQSSLAYATPDQVQRQVAPTAPAPKPEGMPAFISKARKSELSGLGFSAAEIREMRPAEAHAIITGDRQVATAAFRERFTLETTHVDRSIQPGISQPDHRIDEAGRSPGDVLHQVPGRDMARDQRPADSNARLLPDDASHLVDQRAPGGADPLRRPGARHGAQGPAVTAHHPPEANPQVMRDLWAAAADAAQTSAQWVAAREVLATMEKDGGPKDLGDAWDRAANASTSPEQWAVMREALSTLRDAQEQPIDVKQPAVPQAVPARPTATAATPKPAGARAEGNPQIMRDLWAAATDAAQTSAQWAAAREVLATMEKNGGPKDFAEAWDQAANASTSPEQWAVMREALSTLRDAQERPIDVTPSATPARSPQAVDAPVPARPIKVARGPRTLADLDAWYQSRLEGVSSDAEAAALAAERQQHEARLTGRPRSQHAPVPERPQAPDRNGPAPTLSALWDFAAQNVQSGQQWSLVREVLGEMAHRGGPRTIQDVWDHAAEAAKTPEEFFAIRDLLRSNDDWHQAVAEGDYVKGATAGANRVAAASRLDTLAPGQSEVVIDRDTRARRKAALDAANRRLSLWRLATSQHLPEKAAKMAREILADARKERNADKGEKPITAAIMQAGKVWDGLQGSAKWAPPRDPKAAAFMRFQEAHREFGIYEQSLPKGHPELLEKTAIRQEKLAALAGLDPALASRAERGEDGFQSAMATIADWQKARADDAPLLGARHAAAVVAGLQDQQTAIAYNVAAFDAGADVAAIRADAAKYVPVDAVADAVASAREAAQEQAQESSRSLEAGM